MRDIQIWEIPHGSSMESSETMNTLNSRRRHEMRRVGSMDMNTGSKYHYQRSSGGASATSSATSCTANSHTAQTIFTNPNAHQQQHQLQMQTTVSPRK